MDSLTRRTDGMLDTLTKSTEEITSFGQGNVEAIMKSGQVWAAGMQRLSQTIAEATQAHLDHTMSIWKAMGSVKSLKEAVELQTNLARSSVEAAFAETGKLTEASMKLAEQTMAPITARITLAVEKITHQVN